MVLSGDGIILGSSLTAIIKRVTLKLDPWGMPFWDYDYWNGFRLISPKGSF